MSLGAPAIDAPSPDPDMLAGTAATTPHPLQPTGHRSVGESITRGAFALLSTQPLTWAVSLTWSVAAPRLLGAEALGEVTVASTIAILAATVATLGISEYMVRRIAQHPERLRHDAGIAFTVQMLAALVGTLLLALVGWWLPGSFVNYSLLLVALLQLLAAPAQTVLLSCFRGTERHKNYAWFNAAIAVICPIGALLVLVAGGDAVQSTAAFGVLMIVTTLATWRLSGLRPVLPAIDDGLWAKLWECLRGGLPFLSWQLTLAVYGGIDRLLLAAMVPAYEIGWYAAAYRIIGMTVFVPTLVVTPLFPALSRSAQAPEVLRRTIAQTLRVLLVLMMGLVAGSIVVAPAIPSVLGWPEDFESAVPLMMILALHLPIVALDMVLGVVLMAIHRETRLVAVGVGAAVFNIALNLMAIPATQSLFDNGAVGAAAATVLTEVFMCIGAVALIPKHLLDARIAWDGARLAAAGVAAIVVGLGVLAIVRDALPLPAIGLVAAGSAAMTAYLLVTVMVRAVTAADVQAVLRRRNARAAASK